MSFKIFQGLIMQISLFQLSQIRVPTRLYELGFTKRDLELYVGAQLNKFRGIRAKLIHAQQKNKEDKAEFARISEFVDRNIGWCEEIRENFKLFDAPVQYELTAAAANRYLDDVLED
jgi:hypothetical protein